MPSLLDYYMQHQAPQFSAGAPPAAPPPIPRDPSSIEIGQSISQGFGGLVERQKEQEALARQDAELAKQEAQIELAREKVFEGVATGSLPETALTQFDVAPNEAKLALAQQAFAPPPQLSPKDAAQLALAEQAQQLDRDKFGLDQRALAQEQGQFETSQGLDEQRLAQELALAQQEAQAAQQQQAVENELAQAGLGIDAQKAIPEILQLVDAAGLERTPENIEKIAQAQANRTLNITGEQRKAATTVGRLENANSQLKELEAGGFNAAAVDQQIGRIPVFGKYLEGPEKKKYDNLASEWSETYLRKVTGAQATEAEVAQAKETYFPVAGDGPQEIANKASLRDQIQGQFEGEAANALPPEAKSAPATDPNAKFNRQSSSGIKYRVLQ